MAVTGPSRRHSIGTMRRDNGPPERVDMYTEDQYVVRGWNDIVATLSSAKVAGVNQPTWSTYRDGISAYSFSASTMNELWINFHILHDYAVGSKVYIHVHWSPNTTDTGVVRWGIEYTSQKGHNQGAFPTTTTVYLEDNVSSADQYGHRIIEMTDAQAFSTNLETDSLILCRIFRDAANAADTFTGVAFGLQVDIHYQADKDYTPGKSPPFFR